MTEVREQMTIKRRRYSEMKISMSAIDRCSKPQNVILADFQASGGAET